MLAGSRKLSDVSNQPVSDQRKTAKDAKAAKGRTEIQEEQRFRKNRDSGRTEIQEEQGFSKNRDSVFFSFAAFASIAVRFTEC
jgi:hypothetical protein